MTIEIQMTQGFVTVIDDIDADLSNTRWWISKRNKLYVLRRVKINNELKYIHLHRVVMERQLGRVLDKKELIDHINGDGLDNRRCNLRVATNQQNLSNSKKRVNNASGYKGVSFRKDHNKWEAQIKCNYRKIHLGFFDNPEDAHKAYCEASKQYHGEFSRTE